MRSDLGQHASPLSSLVLLRCFFVRLNLVRTKVALLCVMVGIDPFVFAVVLTDLAELLGLFPCRRTVGGPIFRICPGPGFRPG